MAHLRDQLQDQVNRVRDHLNRALVRWRQLRDSHPHEMKAAIRVSGAAAIVCVIAAAWFLLSLARSLPDRESLTAMGEMDQATAVYDASDTLAFTIFKEQRIDVPLESMGPHLVKALIAIEDRRFYDHHGFDVVRIVSAALKNLRHLRVVQGASTITQQLARTSFLTPDRTYSRKLQEVILAARIERMFSKDRILELYLNKVYFGDGLYGVEAASRGYFAKHASDLTLAEAATLAGLMKSPSRFRREVARVRLTVRG